MKQSTFSAVMANSIKNLLQSYTKGIRFVAVLTLLLTMGIGQAWSAYKENQWGFWQDGGLILTWSANGTSKTTTINYDKIASGGTHGDIITSLILTKTQVKFWRNDHYGHVCSSNVYWELYKGDTKINEDSFSPSTWGNWDGSNNSLTYSTSIDFLAKTTGPGNYTIRVWAELKGAGSDEYYGDVSYKGCGTSLWYNKNSNSYYSITFTIPSKNLTVAGAANGNTVSGAVAGITKGKAYTITATPTTGYSFSKWTATSGASSITIANANAASTTVTFKDYANDATVTASFKPNTYTVQFDGNGSTSGSMSNQSFTYDAAKNLTANAFSKTGYTFAGWATSEDGDAVYADKQSVSNLTNVNNGTVTLYAKWTLNTYTVTWVVDKSTTTETVAHGSKVAKAPKIDPNDLPCGDKFVGWTTEFYAGKTAPTTLYPTAADIPAVTGDVTYYAVFADYEN